MVAAVHPQAALERLGALAHRGQPHAAGVGWVVDAVAVVGDGDGQGSVRGVQGDVGVVGAGVADDVGQRLLGDAVGGRLDRRGQGGEVGGGAKTSTRTGSGHIL